MQWEDVLDMVTADDKAAGLAWYGQAFTAAETLAARFDVSTRQAAGVIAALSPCCPWSRNVKNAELVLAHWAAGLTRETLTGVSNTGANVTKAWAIAAGADPLDILSGDKVRAFYANIMGDWRVVTVDRHAYNAAVGSRAIRTTKTVNLSARNRYTDTAALYIAAADRWQCTPAQAQAIVWVAWRRINKINH